MFGFLIPWLVILALLQPRVVDCSFAEKPPSTQRSLRCVQYLEEIKREEENYTVCGFVRSSLLRGGKEGKLQLPVPNYHSYTSQQQLCHLLSQQSRKSAHGEQYPTMKYRANGATCPTIKWQDAFAGLQKYQREAFWRATGSSTSCVMSSVYNCYGKWHIHLHIGCSIKSYMQLYGLISCRLKGGAVRGPTGFCGKCRCALVFARHWPTYGKWQQDRVFGRSYECCPKMCSTSFITVAPEVVLCATSLPTTSGYFAANLTRKQSYTWESMRDLSAGTLDVRQSIESITWQQGLVWSSGTVDGALHRHVLSQVH